MKVVVPCAGRSSRFPNMLPKWMLPDHDGNPMVYSAVSPLGADASDLIFTVLREHADKFDAPAGLRSVFGSSIQCVILDQPTRSQSETVAATVREANISEPFLVKDSDNAFSLPELSMSCSYVSVASLNDFSRINPRNKSYVQIDQEGMITNFREKKVISDLFSVGGYFFSDPQAFMSAYAELSTRASHELGELYLSEIIAYMILQGTVFKMQRAKGYQDWGTIHEWREHLERRRVFLVALDGFLFEHGSRYFQPQFADVKPHAAAVEAVRNLHAQGHVIKYLSMRPQALAEMTEKQLQENELPPGAVVYDCDVAQWVLLTAVNPSLPFRTSHALEVSVDDPYLMEKVDLTHGER